MDIDSVLNKWIDKLPLTVKNADLYVMELHSAGGLYHFEDDASDILSFTSDQAIKMNIISDSLLSIDGYCPFVLAVKLQQGIE